MSWGKLQAAKREGEMAKQVKRGEVANGPTAAFSLYSTDTARPSTCAGAVTQPSVC